jgi:hypothetical protein
VGRKRGEKPYIMEKAPLVVHIEVSPRLVEGAGFYEPTNGPNDIGGMGVADGSAEIRGKESAVVRMGKNAEIRVVGGQS